VRTSVHYAGAYYHYHLYHSTRQNGCHGRGKTLVFAYIINTETKKIIVKLWN